MKDRVPKTGIGSMIFILLFLMALLLVRPVNRYLSATVKTYAENLRKGLEERTGLTFSYTSLSPSILSAIRMKGIVVTDTATGKKICTVKKLVLSYRLGSIIKGKSERALTDLTLSGLTVEYDVIQNKAVTWKIMQILQSDSVSRDSAEITLPGFLPFSMHVRNASVHYRDKKADILLAVHNISILKNSSGHSFAFSITGQIHAGTDNDTVFTSDFSAAGSLTENLENSNIRVHLSRLSYRKYKINSFNFIAAYGGHSLQFKTLRNEFPLYAELTVNTESGESVFSVKAEKLYPFYSVEIDRPPEIVRKLYDLRTDFELSGAYTLKTGLFSYKSSGIISVPSEFIPEGCSIKYSLSGDKNSLSIPGLSIYGKNYDIYYSGAYNIRQMRPSGTAEIRRLVLPNGGIISTDIYFDALKKGFMCFAPQLYLNDQAFTALQLSVIPQKESVDFSFEGYDYSHTEADTPGSIKFDGSYLFGTKYIQTSISFSNFYLDSLATAIAFPLKGKHASQLRKLASHLKPYIFSGELYVSSDLSTVSYNIPYSVVANTQKERQLLVFSLDGNRESCQISRFDLLYGDQVLAMTAMAEMLPGTNEAFFSSDITFNSVPYKFTGRLSDRWFDITGDYGFHATASFNPSPVNMLEPLFSGSIHMDAFPLALQKYIFTVSSDATFSGSEADGFSCNISQFELQEPSGKLVLSPKLTLTGILNKYGFIVNSFAYSDAVSALTGSGDFLWNINDGIFDSANAEFTASSMLSSETWKLSGSVTNPDRVPFSVANIKKNMYFSGQAEIKDFPSSRLFSGQADSDSLSAVLAINGTLENPYLSLNVTRSSVSVLGSPMVFSGNVMLEDNLLHVSDTSLQWLMMNLSGLDAQYSVNNGSGSATTTFDAKYLQQTVNIPLTINVDSVSKSENSPIPESYIIKIQSDNVSGSLFSAPFAAGFTLIRTKGRFDIYSSGALSISGSVQDTGEILLGTGDGCPIQANVSGFVRTDKGMALKVDGINADLSNFSHLLSYPFLAVYKGTVAGSFTITGFASDPEFNGNLTVANPELNLPIIIPEHWTAARMNLNIQNSELSMDDTEFSVRGNPVSVNLNLSFDRWNFNELVIGIKTAPDIYIPADVNLGQIRITGQGSTDIQISVMPDHTEITGKVLARNTSVNIATSALTAAAADAVENGGTLKQSADLEGYGIVVSLDIIMGQKVQIFLDPMLRGVAIPNTELSLLFDSMENRLQLNSDVKFRGGEIVYLNRNFYMREGRIVFSDKQDIMDPVITVRAETRERDDDGNQVTIILSAENQPFSRFSPILSSTPAKSENEIMELLGQIVAGDSQNIGSLLLSTGDYAVQVTVMRKIENALRDLCNFDIFSIRTMVLQNAMKQGLNLNTGSSKITAGNFFDNSTVYIGKYFGSQLYTDALLHWSYDETRVNDRTTTGGLVFQPEFGLEMSSPFVNIRWSIAPDIDSMKNNLWIPNTSVTLSWKFTF
jgi:hypothetical protein